MVEDPRTKHYIERRMKDGRTKKEAMRCLKRYVAREVFRSVPRSEFALGSPQEHRSGHPGPVGKSRMVWQGLATGKGAAELLNC
jgi:hypothetical protein